MLTIAGFLFLGTVQGPSGWTPCPDDLQPRNRRAECRTVSLPLFHERPTGDTIGIAVMRIRSGRPGASQLWFLDGGPGDAGRASLPRLADLLGDDPPIDYYTLDHRGVGGSARLDCPDQQAAGSSEGREVVDDEWIACMAWLREHRIDLPALTAYQSAHDVGTLIEQFREPDHSIFVMGVSYGSYLAQQYLHLFPDQPDAVILDGLVPPDWSFAEFDHNLEFAADRLLARCAGDSACAKYLGPDPEAFTREMLRKMSGGHCLGLSSEMTQLVMGVMLMGGDPLRQLIPALVYRFDRCAFKDQTAIIWMFQNVFESGAFGSEPESHSQVLQRHVSMSEMWPAHPPTPDSLVRAVAEYLMTTNVSRNFADTYREWPRAASHVRKDFPKFNGPMLLLHGGLDPTMPLERLEPMRQHFSAPQHTWAIFPDGPHVVVNDYPCAVDLYRAFLREPNSRPDTDCISDSPRLSFDPADDPTQFVFGTTDTWGDRETGWFKKVTLWAVWGVAALASVVALR